VRAFKVDGQSQNPWVSFLLGLLSMQYCSVVPHEVTEKYGKDFRSHPCGTGPFRFVENVVGEAYAPVSGGATDTFSAY